MSWDFTKKQKKRRGFMEGKRRLTKWTVATLTLFMLVGSMMISAEAATGKTAHVSGSDRFAQEWEKTTTYKVGDTKIGKMVYGFDKDWIYEDYCWTYGYECSTRPKICRVKYDSEYQLGSKKGEDKWSKYEIKHYTYDVKYRIVFSATYSDLSSTTVESHRKE